MSNEDKCIRDIQTYCKKDYGGFFSGKKPITGSDGMKACKMNLKAAGVYGRDKSETCARGDDDDCNHTGCAELSELGGGRYAEAIRNASMSMKGGKRRRKTRKRKSKKNKKTRSKKQKGGKEDFGTYKDGSSVFKDKNGYYIDEWDNDKQVIYKKYLKSWKPVISDTRLILDKKTKKWKIVKSKKTKIMKKSSKKTKTSRCPNGTRKNKKSGKCEKK